MKSYIKIHPKDSVAVAIVPLHKGEILDVEGGVELLSDIPMGHKFALKDFAEGEIVTKYGFPIAHATRPIKKGEHVHVHNADTNLAGKLDYEYEPDLPTAHKYENEGRSFMGFRRWNGDYGIRNELWIIPTVGCVNAIGSRIKDRFLMETVGRTQMGCVPEGIDDVQVFAHPYGCGQEGYDAKNTENALAMAVRHPNCGGVLVLGLGCEDIRISTFKEILGDDYDKDRVFFLETQAVENDIELGTEYMHKLYEIAKNDKREPAPLSALRIGLECGGSDGFSGLTGNPLLGELTDYMVAQGGTTVMTEVAEMFGSEQILMTRARTREVFDKIVAMINGYKQYCFDNGATITGNPSPGNLDGGITTLEDKALGCTQKGGQAIVEDVIEYGKPVTVPGFNLLWAPGSDTAGTTALGLCCQMVVFTTGRGTPYGGFIPTVKVATNTKMYEKKKYWNDFNAGRLAEGESMEKLVREFVDQIIGIAGGELCCAEKNGFKEFVIWKNGVSE